MMKSGKKIASNPWERPLKLHLFAYFGFMRVSFKTRFTEQKQPELQLNKIHGAADDVFLCKAFNSHIVGVVDGYVIDQHFLDIWVVREV